ncbi:MAG TPA: fructose-6-phosphate aldolase [Acidobacteriota bacterium]|nr:fructose-6-phosphate aldolase [Acidobacteriota bacterium]
MKFFLDTANLNEIREANSWGILDGITTNPSLVEKEGKNFYRLIEEISKMVDGPVSAEVTATDTEGMIHEGEELSKIHSNVTVKIPFIKTGMAAIKALSEKGIPVNVTLIFSPVQALMAAKVGATYVSPFVGRLDDIAHEGMELVGQIIDIFANYDFGTQVLVASCRSPLHIVEAARLGAGVATLPFKVMEQMIHHPLTDAGLKKFLADWEKLPKELRELPTVKV